MKNSVAFNKFFLCCLLMGFLFFKANGQLMSKPFIIYYDSQRYTQTLQQELDLKPSFKKYNLMLEYQIDPNKTGSIDKDIFLKNLKNFFPNTSSEGVLCIDLENKVFDDLIKFDESTIEFKRAKETFIWMIKRSKIMFPNVRVGIYGLPLRDYYFKTIKDYRKFDSILVLTDIIFPSLYTMYPDSQFGRVRNEKYLKDNLVIALELGIRLNKPVIPFVWNVVHPSNKKYGGKLIDANEMIKNVVFIKEFRFKDNVVEGVVWWDPDYKSFNKLVKSSYNLDNNHKEVQTSLFEGFIKDFSMIR